MLRNTNPNTSTVRALLTLLLIVGCLAFAGCTIGDASASQHASATTDVELSQSHEVTELRAEADLQKAQADSHKWLAQRGTGSGGMFDMSGIELRRAAGLTKTQLERRAADAELKAENLAQQAEQLESSQRD